jgi:RNA polymerase primary sigma factor
MTFDPLTQYLTEVRQAPRLEEQNEAELVRRIRAGIEAANQLERGAPSPGERDALVREQKEGEKAKRALIEGNLRLVVEAALRHPDVHFPLLDLIQEGNIGLIRAVEGFDPDQGGRFEVFAARLIEEAISRATEAAEAIQKSPASPPDTL